ncbi:MAG: nicotinate (nicotinamide) nucleotide adenylyltransferase [Myxococcota bacterium]|nr:nicotinate (nicotinamide) nucleotide adenylyltransferase [Myxococcota bacterium]
MTTLAVFGGSFDPPHVGHVLAATWVLSATDVDEVVVVPTGSHAFGKALTPFPHRLRMSELAFAPVRGARISRIEAQRAGPSYMIDTLEALAATGASLRLVVGTDLVEQIPRWHQGHRIPALAPLLVVGRGGHAEGHEDIVMPDVSSTEVRRRLRAGEEVDALVPRAVRRYVARHQLYRGEE